MWAPVMSVRAEKRPTVAAPEWVGPDGEREPGSHAEHPRGCGRSPARENTVASRRQTLVVTPLSVPTASPAATSTAMRVALFPDREIGRR
jgi:hypothetical protein